MTEASRIALDVVEIDQLFASYDPSPFHSHSLNATAAQYIFSQAWYAPRRAGFVVELSIRGRPASADEAARLEDVLRVHFRRLAKGEEQNLRTLMRTGLISLAIGICVLAVCTILSRAVDASALPDGWREGLRDGISVFGWVANWRPAQILLYDWWPVRRSRNLYRRLALAEVVPAGPARRAGSAEADPALDTVPAASTS